MLAVFKRLRSYLKNYVIDFVVFPMVDTYFKHLISTYDWKAHSFRYYKSKFPRTFSA